MIISPSTFFNIPILFEKLKDAKKNKINFMKIYVNKMPIIQYCIYNQYADVFDFLISNGLSPNLTYNYTPILFIIYNMIIYNSSHPCFIDTLCKNGVNIYMKENYRKCTLCETKDCDCKRNFLSCIIYDILDGIIDFNKYKVFMDIICNYNELREDYFIESISSKRIDVIDYVFEKVKFIITDKSLNSISKIPASNVIFKDDFNEYKTKFIIQIYNNLLRDNNIEDVETEECVVCFNHNTIHPIILEKIYHKKCSCCPSKVHNCDHDKLLCLSCLEFLIHKECPVCRAPSGYTSNNKAIDIPITNEQANLIMDILDV